MAFWKNTHTNLRVYPESDQYYNSNSNKKTVLAWLAAFGSLLVIVGLFLGLFFGGKWTYKQLKNNDTSNVASSESNTASGTETSVTVNSGTDNSADGNTNIGTTTPTPQDGSNSNTTPSGPRISNDSTNEPGISTKPTMPNTGATLNTLAVLFGVVATTSTILYARRQQAD